MTALLWTALRRSDRWRWGNDSARSLVEETRLCCGGVCRLVRGGAGAAVDMGEVADGVEAEE